VFGDGVPINLPAWVTAALVPLLRPVSAVWEWQAVTEWIALLPHPFRQEGESQGRPSGRRQSAVLAVASPHRLINGEVPVWTPTCDHCLFAALDRIVGLVASAMPHKRKRITGKQVVLAQFHRVWPLAGPALALVVTVCSIAILGYVAIKLL
jgi:hypothetical protein